MSICTLEGCDRKLYARGLCGPHYQRLRKYGRTTPMERLVAPRFWSKVDKTNECWLWTASRDTHGYGTFRRDGCVQKAHRVSWELTHGLIPDGLHVCHRCDVPACVNPDHLFLGTMKDNMQDRNAKGRAASKVGVNNGRARLTERGVVVVREMAVRGMTHKAIGDYLGLHESTIRYAVIGKHWSHL